jgi:hypothetical protein
MAPVGGAIIISAGMDSHKDAIEKRPLRKIKTDQNRIFNFYSATLGAPAQRVIENFLCGSQFVSVRAAGSSANPAQVL